MRRRRGIGDVVAAAACSHHGLTRACADGLVQALRHPRLAICGKVEVPLDRSGARPARCGCTCAACPRRAQAEARSSPSPAARPGGHAVCGVRGVPAGERPRRPRGRDLRPARNRPLGDAALPHPRGARGAARERGRRRRRLRRDARAAPRLLHDPRLGRGPRGGAAGNRRRQGDPLRRLLRDQAGACLRGGLSRARRAPAARLGRRAPTARTPWAETPSARCRACCASCATGAARPSPRTPPRTWPRSCRAWGAACCAGRWSATTGRSGPPGWAASG